MSKAHQNQIVRDAQKLYARAARHFGYDLDLSTSAELQLFYDFAGDDEATIRRAAEICRDEGAHFTGRSVEHGYGESRDADGFSDDEESSDDESYDESDDSDD